MKTLAELADEIWAWQQATFGDAMTVQGALNKLQDECGETLAAYGQWANGRTSTLCEEQGLLEELADAFFMLVQIGGLTTDDVEGCGLVLEWLALDGAEPFLVCMGRLKAHALWADRWTGLLLAKSAWLDAVVSIGASDRIPAAIEAKLAKNQARTWAKPAADGTISHVKEVG